MMDAAKLARAITFLVTMLYTIVLFVTHSSLGDKSARIISYIPTVIGFGLLAFDLWGWKVPFIHPFVGRPRIDGTWLGSVQPSPESKIPPEGNRGPIPAALIIHQTYWSLGVTLMTAESESQSMAASLRSDPDSPGRRVLAYVYANTPEQKHRGRSPPHVGASQMKVVGRVPKDLVGTYWTARFTAGDMKFRLVNRELDYANLDAVIAAADKRASEEGDTSSQPNLKE